MMSSVSRRFRPDGTRVSCHLPAQNDMAAWSGELQMIESLWIQDFCVTTMTEPRERNHPTLCGMSCYHYLEMSPPYL